MSEERVYHSLIKDSSSLGDQTNVKSLAPLRHPSPISFHGNKFLVPILPKERLAREETVTMV